MNTKSFELMQTFIRSGPRCFGKMHLDSDKHGNIGRGLRIWFIWCFAPLSVYLYAANGHTFINNKLLNCYGTQEVRAHDMKNACWKIKSMKIKCSISGVNTFIWQIEGNTGKTLKSWLLSACSSETPGNYRSQRALLKWNDNRKLKYWSKQVQENRTSWPRHPRFDTQLGGICCVAYPPLLIFPVSLSSTCQMKSECQKDV